MIALGTVTTSDAARLIPTGQPGLYRIGSQVTVARGAEAVRWCSTEPSTWLVEARSSRYTGRSAPAEALCLRNRPAKPQVPRHSLGLQRRRPGIYRVRPGHWG
jgi:hypothetical protein